MSQPGALSKDLTLDQVIVKVTEMVSWDSKAKKLAKKAGLDINYVSWEDCARNKGSSWGPCISDMTLKVNQACMPVIRQPNYSDKTWDVEMNKIPVVIGNHTEEKQQELQTISLKDYLTNFADFMSNDYYNKNKIDIDLTSQKENKDSHVIMSSQACFLPIQSGEETKFNVALYNYQSEARNPAVLVIVSTSKGSSAQIIEGKEQYLLFNNNGKKADFIGERVSDIRKKKGQKNIYDKVLSKEEKQDNCIVIVQVPLTHKQVDIFSNAFGGGGGGFDGFGDDLFGGGNNDMFNDAVAECANTDFDDDWGDFAEHAAKSNVEAAIVKVADRTHPVCICGKDMVKCRAKDAYGGTSICCDICEATIHGIQTVYHCMDKKSFTHNQGYDLCINCGDKQLKFDELRGLLNDDKNYILKRDERYPIRVTLQYYKATDNGVVNKEIMDDIVKQLSMAEKQADFIGSLVTEYNPNRPNEWINGVNDIEMKGDDQDEYMEIRKVLKERCGKNWESYLKNFINEEVNDNDLENLMDEDYRELIPKIGPRNRFKKWVSSRKVNGWP